MQVLQARTLPRAAKYGRHADSSDMHGIVAATQGSIRSWKSDRFGYTVVHIVCV